MSLFGKHEKEQNKSLIAAYLESIEKVYKIGGFPLTVFSSAILLLLISVWLLTTGAIVAQIFPYVVFLTSLLAIIGIAIYIFEKSWKRKMMQRSLDRFDELISILFTRYLEKEIDYEKLKTAFELLSTITGVDIDRINESLKLHHKQSVSSS